MNQEDQSASRGAELDKYDAFWSFGQRRVLYLGWQDDINDMVHRALVLRQRWMAGSKDVAQAEDQQLRTREVSKSFSGIVLKHTIIKIILVPR